MSHPCLILYFSTNFDPGITDELHVKLENAYREGTSREVERYFVERCYIDRRVIHFPSYGIGGAREKLLIIRGELEKELKDINRRLVEPRSGGEEMGASTPEVNQYTKE